MYTPEVMDHFRHPRNRGSLPGATATAEARYDPCGDWLRLDLRVEDGVVAEARFDAAGCGFAVAAGSVGTELLLGRTPEEGRNLTAFDLDRALGGVPPQKRHALLMVLQCVAGTLGPRTPAPA